MSDKHRRRRQFALRTAARVDAAALDATLRALGRPEVTTLAERVLRYRHLWRTMTV
jgi:hypothetical protein